MMNNDYQAFSDRGEGVNDVKNRSGYRGLKITLKNECVERFSIVDHNVSSIMSKAGLRKI